MAALRRLLTAVSAVLLEVLGGLMVAFTAVRALSYPFWAAQATHAELARSWGGPGAVGATLAHWAVALPTLAVGWLLLGLGVRLRARRRQHSTG